MNKLSTFRQQVLFACRIVLLILFLVKESTTSMEGSSRNGEICPKLLEFIPQGRRRNWFQDEKTSVYNTEEKKLELKLGPPGDEYEDCTTKKMIIKKEPKDKSILSGNNNNKTTSHKRFDFYLLNL